MSTEQPKSPEPGLAERLGYQAEVILIDAVIESLGECHWESMYLELRNNRERSVEMVRVVDFKTIDQLMSEHEADGRTSSIIEMIEQTAKKRDVRGVLTAEILAEDQESAQIEVVVRGMGR